VDSRLEPYKFRTQLLLAASGCKQLGG